MDKPGDWREQGRLDVALCGWSTEGERSQGKLERQVWASEGGLVAQIHNPMLILGKHQRDVK